MLAYSVLCLWSTLNPKLSSLHLLHTFLCNATFLSADKCFFLLCTGHGMLTRASLSERDPEDGVRRTAVCLLPSLLPSHPSSGSTHSGLCPEDGRPLVVFGCLRGLERLRCHLCHGDYSGSEKEEQTHRKEAKEKLRFLCPKVPIATPPNALTCERQSPCVSGQIT